MAFDPTDLVHPPVASPLALLIAMALPVVEPWGPVRRRHRARSTGRTGPADGIEHWPPGAQTAAGSPAATVLASRPRMISSASVTIRDTSSSQVGMSRIRPWTMPADQMPWSRSPVS